ncbi:MAG: hypothetical protein IK032_04105 [Bacteroidales bacterium]|nr:hypothetical protein [Bacteroidales bacterium]
MPQKILYIHGFNSAGGGHKAVELQKMFPQCEVLSPTFDYKNPAAVQKKLDSLVRTQRVGMVMGTSLGGFFAIYCSAKHAIPAVVINPTVKPSQTLAKMVGKQKNYVTREEYQFTAADLAKFADFEQKVFDKLTFVGSKLHFALSTNDELLGDHHYLEQRFPDCHDFNYFDQQGHRFAGVKILKPIIERGMNN